MNEFKLIEVSLIECCMVLEMAQVLRSKVHYVSFFLIEFHIPCAILSDLGKDFNCFLYGNCA